MNFKQILKLRLC